MKVTIELDNEEISTVLGDVVLFSQGSLYLSNKKLTPEEEKNTSLKLMLWCIKKFPETFAYQKVTKHRFESVNPEEEFHIRSFAKWKVFVEIVNKKVETQKLSTFKVYYQHKWGNSPHLQGAYATREEAERARFEVEDSMFEAYIVEEKEQS